MELIGPDGCIDALLVVETRIGVAADEEEKVYGMVEPLLVTQPYVGKNVVVEHVLWTVTVTTETSNLSAEFFQAIKRCSYFETEWIR